MEEKVFRFDTLEWMMAMNLSQTIQGSDANRSYIEKISGRSGAGISNVRNLIPALLDFRQSWIMKFYRERCFPEFCVIDDATPCFAEAVAIIVRIVTFDLQIVDIMISCKLLQKSLTGVELGTHVLTQLTSMGFKCRTHLYARAMDCCATNGVAHRTLVAHAAGGRQGLLSFIFQA